MNVLFMSSEFFPFAKTGGLADVSEAIALNLVKKGINVAACLPYYNQVQKQNLRMTGKILKMEIEISRECVKIFEDKKNIAKELKFFDILPYKYKGVNIYFFKNDYLFNREFIYGLADKDYEDNLLRFSLFCQVSLAFFKDNNIKFDIIHANDWQTSLIPIFSKFKFRLPSKILLTIHNLGYQGIFPKEQFPCTGINSSLFNPEGLEYFDKINLLKGGIEFSDTVNTVSKKYSAEIQTEEFGFGLSGVLKNKEKIYGVLNGIDYDEWNPEMDKYINKNYSAKNFKTGKKSCKRDLLNIFFGKEKSKTLIDKPLLGIVSRLEDQKGFDIFIKIISRLVEKGCIIAVLGEGGRGIEDEFKKIAETYPGEFAVKIIYDNPTAHKMEAGSDFLIMPSKYEPCGQSQMYGMKYGTIPIVRATGGLDDTIISYDGSNINIATGFKFYKFDASELEKVISIAVGIYYNDKKTLNSIITNAMNLNLSWDKRIDDYISLYNDMLNIKH
ncbi:MAG: glycogen/starch synthase [Deltaproteobacteria bacterium]|nr:glycogen/starch synthase [Deltaproteobacteria bacterium]